MKWSDIKVISTGKNDINKFIFKTSYEDEFKSVCTKTRRLTKTNVPSYVLKKVYSHKLQISEAKKRGILKLIEKNVVPKYYETFYISL